MRMRFSGTVFRVLFGGVLWGVLCLFPLGTGILNEIARVLLFVMLVLLPLGIPLVEPNEAAQSNMYKTARFLHPVAGLIAGASFLFPPGVIAGTLAIAWLPFCGFLTWHGVERLRRRGVRASLKTLDEFCIDAALIYLPVGAIWLWASRMGIRLMGFEEPIVLLTAIHFHFAGFAAPLLAGLAGRHLRQAGRMGYFFVAAGVIILGPALVALGITLSRAVEVVSAVLLAAGYLGLAGLVLVRVLRAVPGITARILLALSALSVVVTMFAATGFAYGNFSGAFTITIPTMVNVHGWTNALGFVGCGFLGWTINQRARGPR